MIKFVSCSPPGKIISDIFCKNYSAFDWATVSLECQTGQTYWRSGPGRITVQKQTLRWAGEWSKKRISSPQNEKLFWGGSTPAPQGQILDPVMSVVVHRHDRRLWLLCRNVYFCPFRARFYGSTHVLLLMYCISRDVTPLMSAVHSIDMNDSIKNNTLLWYPAFNTQCNSSVCLSVRPSVFPVNNHVGIYYCKTFPDLVSGHFVLDDSCHAITLHGNDPISLLILLLLLLLLLLFLFFFFFFFLTQSHCVSSPGSRDKCRKVPDGRWSLDQADGLDPLARL